MEPPRRSSLNHSDCSNNRDFVYDSIQAPDLGMSFLYIPLDIRTIPHQH